MRTLAGLLPLILALPAKAELHFPQTEVRLGEVLSGRPLKQRFTFANQGPGVVEIQRLSATCGCMTPRLKKQVYQPGEEGAFALEVNTLTQPAGPNRWRVQVHYREGGREQTRELTILATLRREIRVEPPRIAISTSTPIGHEVLVTDERARPLHITKAVTTSAHLTATVRDEGHTHRVRLGIEKTLPPGTHEETLVLLSDDPTYPRLHVPVTIIMRPKEAISAAPSSVDLTVTRGQPISRVVLLRGNEEREVIVEKIETDNPALSCRWAAGPGKLATLKVAVDGTKVTDVLRGTVKVHIRGSTPSVVSIPVSCTVR